LVSILSNRALNRALLQRQALSSRSAVSAAVMVERLVGMQGQAPLAPYFGLWSRLVDFAPEQLSDLVRDRAVVRIALMRNTIHLVGAQDCRVLRPLLQPMLARSFGSSVHARHVGGLDAGELADAGRDALTGGPLSPGELGARLSERWPGRDAGALANAVRTHLPLVQVPPRGLWGQGGPARHVAAESWLEGSLSSFGSTAERDAAMDDVVRRYLAAFGPASVRDVQVWSGLTRLGEVVRRLRAELRVFRDENGVELFDVPGAGLPDEDTPAPVRLVAPFDNLTLSHADRSRIISDDHRKRLGTMNGLVPGMVLVDGFVAGCWRLEQVKGAQGRVPGHGLAAPDGGRREGRGGERVAVRLDVFRRLSAAVRDELCAEAGRLGRFAQPDADVEVEIRVD
jgi:hypothetical protein